MGLCHGQRFGTLKRPFPAFVRVCRCVCAWLRVCVTDRQCGSAMFVYHCSTMQLVRQVAFFFFSSLLCPHSPVSPNFLSYRMQILNLFSERCSLFFGKVAQRQSYTDSSLTFHPDRSFYSAGARLRETCLVSEQSNTNSPFSLGD